MIWKKDLTIDRINKNNAQKHVYNLKLEMFLYYILSDIRSSHVVQRYSNCGL